MLTLDSTSRTNANKRPMPAAVQAQHQRVVIQAIRRGDLGDALMIGRRTRDANESRGDGQPHASADGAGCGAANDAIVAFS